MADTNVALKQPKSNINKLSAKLGKTNRVSSMPINPPSPQVSPQAKSDEQIISERLEAILADADAAERDGRLAPLASAPKQVQEIFAKARQEITARYRPR